MAQRGARTPMTSYDAVVYDMDGTLVELDVDWEDARKEVAARLRARGIQHEGASLWELFEAGVEAGYWPIVHETLAEHEREGARTSWRLDLADDLPRELPVGVCSLNATSACRIALEMHGIDGYVDAVVGRDSVDSYKPDPKPLLAAIQAIGGDAESALFIGDSERDERTADRAGVAFQYVSDV